jgi:ribonuclease T1
MLKNLLILSISLFFALSCRNNNAPSQSLGNTQSDGAAQSDYSAQPNENTNTNTKKGKAPDYVLQVLDYVKQNGDAPKGYVGGRNFQNRENRLPKISNQGAKIKYQEWDVFPKEQGKNRGVERLITGSDKSAWYTKNHYKSFVRVE